MADAPLSLLCRVFPFSCMELPVSISFFLALSFLVLVVSLYSKGRKIRSPVALQQLVLSGAARKTCGNQNQPLIVEILTSDDASLGNPLQPPSAAADDHAACLDGFEFDAREDFERSEGLKGKKRKKRGKKKRQNTPPHEESQNETEQHAAKENLGSMYPFTSSASVTQRKIKQQYDQLVKSNDAKALTMAQVGQFANCLIEARSELQHKSEIIQRKFTITKALLFKADRSSFDRLCQQIYRLEAEQKRLEEDTLVYNRLQEQLKLSPAYKKMLEVASRMELQTNSDELVETLDAEFPDISFEELLAQEKKDSFWQRNGKLRSSVN